MAEVGERGEGGISTGVGGEGEGGGGEGGGGDGGGGGRGLTASSQMEGLASAQLASFQLAPPERISRQCSLLCELLGPPTLYAARHRHNMDVRWQSMRVRAPAVGEQWRTISRMPHSQTSSRVRTRRLRSTSTRLRSPGHCHQAKRGPPRQHWRLHALRRSGRRSRPTRAARR